MHPVEEGEVNMFDGHPGLQIFGESFGHLAGYPVLAKGGLDKNIDTHQQKDECKEEPL
jgi:hypothetical protein